MEKWDAIKKLERKGGKVKISLVAQQLLALFTRFPSNFLGGPQAMPECMFLCGKTPLFSVSDL